MSVTVFISVMKSMLKYLTANAPLNDSGSAQFFDEWAQLLHDRTVYDIIKNNVRDMHPILINALLETLDDHDLELIEDSTDWFEIKVLKGRLLDGRIERAKAKNSSHKLNYPIEEVLDDFVERRKGKRVEAKRQLKKRFDGQEHAMQEQIMFALMEYGDLAERNFVYDRLFGDDFWVDAYIPLVQAWWEQFGDHRMARVVVKRCGRKYILEHLEELMEHGNYANICIKTGITPDPDKLSPQTYLFVLKSIHGQLRFREGERTVLRAVRDYLYEHSGEWENDRPVESIYDVPYVRRMMAYLGEMGMIEDIMAIDAFDKRMRSVPSRQWANAVIKAIEEEFPMPEYVFQEVK